MRSDIYEMMHDASETPADVRDFLYTKLKNLYDAMAIIKRTLYKEMGYLDAIMNVHGDNPEHHHAKTMIYYGRKVCIGDVVFGVTSTSKSYEVNTVVGDHLVDQFDGLDKLLEDFDYGRVEVKWDCLTGMTGVYKTGHEPANTSLPSGVLTEHHKAGTIINMPNVEDMGDEAAGTTHSNAYKIKAGYKIIGWKHATTTYLVDDNGNYILKDPDDDTTKVPDKRIFQQIKDVGVAGEGSFKSPHMNMAGGSGGLAPMSYRFNLAVIKLWYDIDFAVPHAATVSPNSPVNIPIKTSLGMEIALPIPSLITMESGYQIDRSSNQFGQWTAVSPTGVAPTDDGDPIDPNITVFNAGETFIVGQDISAAIRHLWLVVTAVTS